LLLQYENNSDCYFFAYGGWPYWEILTATYLLIVVGHITFEKVIVIATATATYFQNKYYIYYCIPYIIMPNNNNLG